MKGIERTGIGVASAIKRQLKRWRLLAALVIVAGCGGHTGNDVAGVPGSAGTGGSGVVGNGTVAPGSITPAQKGTMLAGIRSKMKSIGTTSPTYATQMLAAVKGMDGVYTAEIEPDNNIAVVFSDGTWLTIFNNQYDSQAAPIQPFPTVMPQIRKASPKDLPQGTSTRIINYFSSQAHTGPANNIATMLQKKGYDAPTMTDASIQNFSISGATVAYLDVHGGISDFLDPTDPTHKKVTTQFALITNTSAPFTAIVDPKGNITGYTPIAGGDKNLTAMVNNGTVGLGIDPEDTTNSVLIVLPPSYLSGVFQFPGTHDSILINTACESNSSAAASSPRCASTTIWESSSAGRLRR